jgi:GNAT superfamily N-acetyltransferase
MIRMDLHKILQYPLPTDYFFRWYRPSDEKIWLAIQLLAEKYEKIDLELYKKEFGSHPEALAERQCFLCSALGEPLGTATAWFDPAYYQQPFGRVHWVAIIPALQGHGLARPLMSLICQRLAELGHQQAYLVTSKLRLPAINLYLKFGFVPDIRHEADRIAWQGVQTQLGKDVLTNAFFRI